MRVCRRVLMAYGFDRFLTTHTGSLPRPDDLIRTMFAKEEGVPVDRAALAARIGEAVAEVVKKQVTSGVDLVNGGGRPHVPARLPSAIRLLRSRTPKI